LYYCAWQFDLNSIFGLVVIQAYKTYVCLLFVCLFVCLLFNISIFHIQLIRHSMRMFTGQVYILGCTNAGKSSLFNALLSSDFCRIAARDIIQRATSSLWPGMCHLSHHSMGNFLFVFIIFIIIVIISNWLHIVSQSKEIPELQLQ